MSAALTISNLKIGYHSRKTIKTVAGPLNLTLNAGELICLIGPNGSGKSTLMKTLASLLPSLGGEILLDTINIAQISQKTLAQKLSIVLTEPIVTGNLTVYDLVSFGRYPYTGWFGTLSETDRQQIEWAINSTGLNHFIQRNIHELSDGERQKAMIARALSQDTGIILLDEPTAHLDLPNRVEIIHLLKTLSRNTKKAILLSTHELDLALQGADKLWMFSSDGKLISGAPEDLVLSGTLENSFSGKGVIFDNTTGGFRLIEPHCDTISVSGDKVPAYWTRRALERTGFEVAEAKITAQNVIVKNHDGHLTWECHYKGNDSSHTSIESLTTFLKRGGAQ